MDGFPRDVSQAASFVQFIGPPTIVIHLDVSDSIMNERCTKRMNFDDTPESIIRRIEEFNANTMSLVRKWKNITITIDGNRETKEVFEDIKTALNAEHAFKQVDLDYVQ